MRTLVSCPRPPLLRRRSTSSLGLQKAAQRWAAARAVVGRRGVWPNACACVFASASRLARRSSASRLVPYNCPPPAAAQTNTDRFEDPEKVATDNWPGGFYMEVLSEGCTPLRAIRDRLWPWWQVWVDGWDIDKTVTLDFHTADIEFPKRACQNVKVKHGPQLSRGMIRLPLTASFPPAMPACRACRPFLTPHCSDPHRPASIAHPAPLYPS